MGALGQDLIYGSRMYVKALGLTSAAIATLAMGIGASTAVFSLVDTILLKPLPYPKAEQIVIPWRLAPPGMNLGYREYPWGRREFFLLLDGCKSFQYLGAFKSDNFNLTGRGDPALIEGLRVSAGFFPSLGVQPELGRVFRAAEDRPGHEHVVILSQRLWRQRFGADRNIVGRSIELNGFVYTVTGVMPAGFSFPRAEEMPGSFEFPREPELWVPLALAPISMGPGGIDELAVIGRLKPGAAIRQAQAELNVFEKREDAEFPKFKGWFGSQVTPLRQQVIGDTRLPMLLLLGAVGVVVLIACSNVANLLLVRSFTRKRELTLRAALGATQARIVRQLLTESVLLAFAGGLGGLLIALGGIRFVKAFGPADIPRLSEVGMDWQVFAFVLTISLLTGVLFGLAPALSAARDNLAGALNEGGQRSVGVGRAKLRNVLLVSEVALALVLVAAAGLLIRTFFHLLSADPGFRTARVLTFEISLPSSRYNRDQAAVVYRKILDGLQGLPGIESAGLARPVPMGGAPDSTVVRILDHPYANPKERPFVNYTIASPGYFAAIGTVLLRGRDFAASDTVASARVTVINRSMARKFWPGEEAIGKQVDFGVPQLPAMTVVGIVGDVKHFSLGEAPGPEMYVPFTQKPWPSMMTMQGAMRTRFDADATIASIGKAVRSVDPDLPVAKVTKLEELVDDSLAQSKFSMLLLGGAGLLSLVLASVGIYGVISYSVAQRTREIGVRMALGAKRESVFGMVLRHGLGISGIGIGIGVAVSLALTRVMTRFLYGVRPNDPVTFTVVCLVLLSVASLASFLPARRAMRIQPMRALRYE